MGRSQGDQVIPDAFKIAEVLSMTRYVAQMQRREERAAAAKKAQREADEARQERERLLSEVLGWARSRALVSESLH